MDYMAYVQEAWVYLPLIMYIFVFLTLLPKSWRKIRSFAEADAAASAGKYHRCYAPDICCHTLEGAQLPKQKPRKAVTRVFPKKQQSQSYHSEAPSSNVAPPSQIQQSQSQTHVNQIAKMFEAGGTTNTSRKVNRVTPILTEIQAVTLPIAPPDSSAVPAKNFFPRKSNANSVQSLKGQQLLSSISQENIENSANLLNLSRSDRDADEEILWRSKRNRRQLPPLSFGSLSSSSSAASPLSSPLPCSSPVSAKASFEDIFTALARTSTTTSNGENAGSLNSNSLLPVSSIEEILAQRRLSRPLSAYSISDLLCDSPLPDEAYIDNFFRNLNKS